MLVLRVGSEMFPTKPKCLRLWLQLRGFQFLRRDWTLNEPMALLEAGPE